MQNSDFASDNRKNVQDEIEELQTFTEGGRKVQFILDLMRRLKAMLDFSSQFDVHGRMIQNARKLSYAEIFGEETQNDEGIFNPPVVYNGYVMTFFKEHRGLLLPNPVKLQQAKFGFLISQLTDDNLQYVKDALNEINVDLEMKIQMDRAFFIRGTNVNWYDINGNMCIPTFGTLVKVKICLQGYKVKDGRRSPIWKLMDVFNC